MIPRRGPKLEVTTASTVSASQMPLATMAIASRHNACWSRLPTNPGTSRSTCTGRLPTDVSSDIIRCTASSLVRVAATTSTKGTRYGGFHQ